MIIAVYKNMSEFSPQAMLSWLYSGTIFFGKETSFPVSPKTLTPHIMIRFILLFLNPIG